MADRSRAAPSSRGNRSGVWVILTAGTVAIACALPARFAGADAYCGAGQHVGSENGDGAGQSWVCTPDRSSGSVSAPSMPSGLGGSNAGAALAGAAAGLQGLAALLDIANKLGSMVSATDAVGSAELDPDKAGIRSRAENRSAIQNMQAGRFGEASTLFNQAALDALAADARHEYWDNMHNAAIADAEAALSVGWAAEQRGDIAAANSSYLRGIQAARSAGAGDLAQKLAAYNDQLAARAGAAGAGVKPTNTVCAVVNGQTICR